MIFAELRFSKLYNFLPEGNKFVGLVNDTDFPSDGEREIIVSIINRNFAR